jgi:RNA polymerase sigma-70 factor (ECF subfamily)
LKQTDEDLLREIARGDSAAFSEFYNRYSRLVYGALLRLLKKPDDAEDILQEVFLQVWRKGSTYQPILGSPKNWLVRIAHNRAINLIRSAGQRTKRAEIAIPEDDSLSILRETELIDYTLLENAINTDRKEMLSSAFKSLSKEQLELLELAFFQGYSHSEISQKLAIPLGTVKTRIRSGLSELRESLAFMETEFT